MATTTRTVLSHRIRITTRPALDGCGTTWTWRTITGPVRAGGTGHSYDTDRGARDAAIDSALTVLGAQDREQAAARAAADIYASRYPRVAQDVTVQLTPSGWVAYDWASRKRIYPAAATPLTVLVAIAIPHTNGTVVRLLSRDNSAWIALDERLDLDVHPFPETDDARHTHVLAWPEDCEPTREVAS